MKAVGFPILQLMVRNPTGDETKLVNILYVNGDHNISIPKKRNGELLEARVKLIEADFHRLMFSTEGH